MLLRIWLLLFTTTSAYRVTEYDKERCTHNEFRSYQVLHTNNNACQKLNVRVASSILVKVDNFYDDQHQLTVYDNNDCTGDIVGRLSNNNGCMSLFSLDDNRVGRSVQLVPKSALTKPERQSNGQGFEAGDSYNVDALGEFMVPIARGSFEYVDRADRSDDGTYRGEAIETFFSGSLKGLRADEELMSWDNLIAGKYVGAGEFEALAEEKWHERLLIQGGFYFNRVYAAVMDWGEQLRVG